MKVLSITEPWATLIKENIKKIETRSWKTLYRGELYIHASSTKMAKETKGNKELMNLIKNKDLNFGTIICKCQLVDCIYMDEKFLKEVKTNHQEYICGEYSLGRYAWILKNIEVLDHPIKVKGHLGLWNYSSNDNIETKKNS